jgi:HAE1 family hydrophobic/amphiphilic exporter-1/multidrug efflux pump
VLGFNFSGTGQNTAIAFVNLKDWSERTEPGQSVDAIIGRAMGQFSQITEAQVFAFAPPPVMELGNATGFDFYLKDSAGVGRQALYEARNQFLGMANQHPDLMRVRPNGQDPAPVLNAQIDKEKAQAMGLTIADINQALSIAWGSAYVDDFIKQEKVKKIYVQGEGEFRSTPENFNDWYLRNQQGEMISAASLIDFDWSKESPKYERYNGSAALQVMGMAAPGVSSGQAMQTVENLVAQLPPGISMEWTGMSYEEQQAGDKVLLLYVLSVLVVFLALAALYESWALPVSVMLIVPLGILGALAAAHLTGKPSDIYFQVGLLTIVGLATKNAILIVEFSKELVEDGLDEIKATIEAAKMRLRPILMTSLAFGFGVVPLAMSSGAGSGAHNAIGNVILGGVISATSLGIFLVPVFFVLMQQWFKSVKPIEDSK